MAKKTKKLTKAVKKPVKKAAARKAVAKKAAAKQVAAKRKTAKVAPKAGGHALMSISPGFTANDAAAT